KSLAAYPHLGVPAIDVHCQLPDVLDFCFQIAVVDLRRVELGAVVQLVFLLAEQAGEDRAEAQPAANDGHRDADVHVLRLLAVASRLVDEDAEVLRVRLRGLRRWRAESLQQLLGLRDGDLAARQHLEHLACLFAHAWPHISLSCSSACATVNSPRDSRSSTSPRVRAGETLSGPCSISTNDNWLPILFSRFLTVG